MISLKGFHLSRRMLNVIIQGWIPFIHNNTFVVVKWIKMISFCGSVLSNHYFISKFQNQIKVNLNINYHRKVVAFSIQEENQIFRKEFSFSFFTYCANRSHDFLLLFIIRHNLCLGELISCKNYVQTSRLMGSSLICHPELMLCMII